MQDIKSPCRNMCDIDLRSGLCQGCFRTLAEITAWPAMTSEARQELMEKLPGREKSWLAGHFTQATDED